MKRTVIDFQARCFPCSHFYRYSHERFSLLSKSWTEVVFAFFQFILAKVTRNARQCHTSYHSCVSTQLRPYVSKLQQSVQSNFVSHERSLEFLRVNDGPICPRYAWFQLVLVYCWWIISHLCCKRPCQGVIMFLRYFLRLISSSISW